MFAILVTPLSSLFLPWFLIQAPIRVSSVSQGNCVGPYACCSACFCRTRADSKALQGLWASESGALSLPPKGPVNGFPLELILLREKGLLRFPLFPPSGMGDVDIK